MSPAGTGRASTSTSTCSARRSSATTRPTPASTRCVRGCAGRSVAYVSVKISALCANLDVLAFDHEVDRIAANACARSTTCGRVLAADLREPRHGGVPRTSDSRWARSACPRRAELAGPRRASSCRPTCPTPTTRSTGSTAWAAGRAPAAARADQGAAREGRQPRDGARRRRAPRLGPGAVRDQGGDPTPATSGSSIAALDAAAHGGLRIGIAQPQPLRRRVGTRPADAARRRRGTSSIEMLKGMAPPQARRCAPLRGGSCSTPRS